MSLEIEPTRELTSFGSLSLPKPLRLYALTTACLAVMSVAYTVIASSVFHQTYANGGILFDGLRPFTDFTIFGAQFAHFRSPDFWAPYAYPFTYPAPLAVVFGAFDWLPDPLASYLGFCLAGMCFGCGLLILHLRDSLSTGTSLLFTAGVAVTCWPCAFLISRANIEGVDALILAVGVLAVLDDRDWLGSALIGIAASMKLFPIILLALLISKRRYAAFAFGLLICGVTTLVSLAILGPSVASAASHIKDGLEYFRHAYAEKLSFPEFDHSLFALYKVVSTRVWGASASSFAVALAIYTPLVAMSGIALYGWRIRSMPLLNQVIALTTCSVLMPPVSYDYTLVHLLVPFGLTCVYVANASRRGFPLENVAPALLCFAVVFAWGTFLNLDGGVAGQVRAVALLALLYFVLRHRFPVPSDRTGAKRQAR